MTNDEFLKQRFDAAHGKGHLLEGVREHGEKLPVIIEIEDGRVVITAFTECGYNNTSIDLLELTAWLDSHTAIVDALNADACGTPT